MHVAVQEQQICTKHDTSCKETQTANFIACMKEQARSLKAYASAVITLYNLVSCTHCLLKKSCPLKKLISHSPLLFQNYAKDGAWTIMICIAAVEIKSYLLPSGNVSLEDCLWH